MTNPAFATDATSTTGWTLPGSRARAAQEHVADLKAKYDAELEKRNRGLREAVDGGAPIKQLALMVGLTRQTIYGIVGTRP